MNKSFKRILFFGIFLFLIISSLSFGITNAKVFAQTLEGIELRQIGSQAIDAEGNTCLYKFNDPNDPNSKFIADDPTTEENESDQMLNIADGYVLTIECIPIMVFNLVYWALVFAGLVALILIIFGGFKFMTSGGDQKAVGGAKKTITWALIGLVTILLSFAIVAFIANITGVSCLTRFGFIGTCGAADLGI